MDIFFLNNHISAAPPNVINYIKTYHSLLTESTEYSEKYLTEYSVIGYY